VMMLRAPEGWLLSVTGCLGMAGLSTAGVAVAINNLQSTDARVGVVWSALVRRALAAGSAGAARDLILSAPIGSGRHYLLADRVGAFGIEASGTRRDLVYRGDEPAYVHTNHCFSDEVGACSRIAPGSTTLDRHAALCKSLEARPVASARDAFARLGSHEGYPRSVCANLSTPQRPHGVATCAAIAMNLASGELLAVAGFPHNVEPDRFSTRP
jgi:isopenicillin-N N-acyltransferase like protein